MGEIRHEQNAYDRAIMRELSRTDLTPSEALAAGQRAVIAQAALVAVQQAARGRRELHCRRCSQSGWTGAYPFATAPNSGLCDDCL